jgi:hypothetical protein
VRNRHIENVDFTEVVATNQDLLSCLTYIARNIM